MKLALSGDQLACLITAAKISELQSHSVFLSGSTHNSAAGDEGISELGPYFSAVLSSLGLSEKDWLLQSKSLFSLGRKLLVAETETLNLPYGFEVDNFQGWDSAQLVGANCLAQNHASSLVKAMMDRNKFAHLPEQLLAQGYRAEYGFICFKGDAIRIMHEKLKPKCTMVDSNASPAGHQKPNIEFQFNLDNQLSFADDAGMVKRVPYIHIKVEEGSVLRRASSIDRSLVVRESLPMRQDTCEDISDDQKVIIAINLSASLLSPVYDRVIDIVNVFRKHLSDFFFDQSYRAAILQSINAELKLLWDLEQLLHIRLGVKAAADNEGIHHALKRFLGSGCLPSWEGVLISDRDINGVLTTISQPSARSHPLLAHKEVSDPIADYFGERSNTANKIAVSMPTLDEYIAPFLRV